MCKFCDNASHLHGCPATAEDKAAAEKEWKQGYGVGEKLRLADYKRSSAWLLGWLQGLFFTVRAI